VWLRIAAPDDDAAGGVPGDCAGAIPRKPGERVKTNTRDARKLAELHRAGLLTEVRPPTAEEEAVRDLCRARDDVREDLQRSRHRLGKLLLRRGLHYSGRNWTQAHRQVDREPPVDADRGARGRGRLPPGDRSSRGAPDQFDARLADIAETVSRTRGLVGLFPRDRHFDGDLDAGRAA
jgi:transposase